MAKRKYIAILSLICILLISCRHKDAPPIITPPKNQPSLFSFHLPTDYPEKIIPVKLIKYDDEIYELAFKVFLQNNNIKDAYTLAAAAVAQRPNTILWRRRFTELAIWNQQPGIAIAQYYFMAVNYKDPLAFSAGLALAKKAQLDEDLINFLNLGFSRGENRLEYWQEYIDANLRLGNPQIAIAQIKAHRSKLPADFYYSRLASLGRVIFDLKFEQRMLANYVATSGSTPKIAIAQAQIFAANNQLPQAFKALTAAKKTAKDSNFTFWSYYTDTATLISNKQQRLAGYLKLVKQKKPEEDIYANVIDLLRGNDPISAYDYAARGLKRYPKSLFLAYEALVLALQIGHLNDFSAIVNNLPAKSLQQYHETVEFWLMQARYWTNRSNNLHARKIYLGAISKFPQHDEIKSDYLLFLIENRPSPEIYQAMQLWESKLCSAPDLWASFIIGYNRLGNRKMTQALLAYYFSNMKNYLHNPYWLLSFRDFLSSVYLTSQASIVSAYAWTSYLQLLARQLDPPDYMQLISYAKLSSTEASGDPTLKVLAILQKQLTPEVADLIFAWSLDKENMELSEQIYQIYLQKGWRLPPELTLTFALKKQDRYLMRKLLINNVEILPYRDRIQAAKEIDNLKLAQTLAYDGLAQHPFEADIYDNYFTPTMLDGSANFIATQENYQYGPVEGPLSKFRLSYFLTPGIKITPYASLWQLEDLAENQIANIPATDARVGIKTEIKQRRGDLTIDLGYREELSNFINALISRSYQIWDNLSAKLSLGYHQESNDTVALLVAGMKNAIALDLNYTLTQKDLFQASLNQNFFYTQDGQYLANGQQETLNYEHKLWLSYPDWSFSLYVTSAQYADINTNVTGSAAELIPLDVTEGSENSFGLNPSNFFIPLNFVEYGISFGFGRNYKEDYSHAWRPFSTFTLSKNSVAGLGWVIDCGIAGTVFGKDHLAIYYSQGTNQGQGVNVTRLLGLSYQYYF